MNDNKPKIREMIKSKITRKPQKSSLYPTGSKFFLAAHAFKEVNPSNDNKPSKKN